MAGPPRDQRLDPFSIGRTAALSSNATAPSHEQAIHALDKAIDAANETMANGGVPPLDPIREALIRLEERPTPLPAELADVEALTRASAFAMIGRVVREQAPDGEWHDALSKSIELFERHINSAPATATRWGDYGFALAALGRGGAAIMPLRRAVEGGAFTAEPYCELATLIHSQRPDEAIALLRTGIKLPIVRPGPCELLANLVRDTDREESIEALMTASRIYAGRNDLESAHTSVDRALELDPSNPMLLAYRGALWRFRGNPQNAVADLMKAREALPEHPYILSNLAMAKGALGEFTAGLTIAEEALRHDPENVLALYAQGLMLRRTGALEAAAASLAKCAELIPPNAGLLAERGEVALELGDNEGARRFFSEAQTLAPDDSTVVEGLGEALLNLGKYTDAVACFERALSLVPDAPRTRGLIAEALLQSDRTGEALQHVTLALTANPDWAYAHLIHGRILNALDRDKDAKQAMRHAVLLNPNDAITHAFLADVLLGLDELEEAIAEAEAARRLNGKLAFAHAVKGIAARRLGKYEDAVVALTRALALGDVSSLLYWETARAHLGLNQFTEARTVLEQAVQRYPEDPIFHGFLAEVLRDLNENEPAAAAARRAVELDPKNVSAWGCLADALRLLNQPAEALEAVDRALQLNENDQWLLGTKAQILSALGRRDEALAAFDLALAQNSDVFWIQFERGELLRLMDRFDDALAGLNEALRLLPDSPVALGTRGQILSALGREQEAIVDMTVALEHDETLTWLYTDLSESLRVTGQNQEALDVLQKALSNNEQDYVAHGSKGAVLTALERDEEADASLTRAIELEPTYAWAYASRADLRAATGRWADALADCNKALAIDPEAKWATQTKGWVLRHMGPQYLDEAQTTYETAIASDPGNEWLRKGLADILFHARKHDRAKAEFSIALELATAKSDPDADLHALIAWCHLRLGRPEEAIPICAETLSFAPSMLSLHFDLALACLVGRRFNVARREYSKALELLESRSRPRQGGLLDVAILDLTETIANDECLGSSSEAGEFLQSLKSRRVQLSEPEVQAPT